jgi:DNA-directed RNA polymerase subunit RPC12/RpoP
MTTIRQEITTFLDGLVIGFLIASILLFLFLYADFVPAYSYLLALFAGGCVAGLIARGPWKGGVSASFSGFFTLFLFQITREALTLDYEFSLYQIMVGFVAAIIGGCIGGFLTRPTMIVLAQQKGEPQKVYVCPQCSAEIPMKTKYCPECGARLQKVPLTEKIQKITRTGGEES